MTALEFTKNDLQYKIIGKNIPEAIRVLVENRVNYRVLKPEDSYTLEYYPDRMNIITESNKVIDAYIG